MFWKYDKKEKTVIKRSTPEELEQIKVRVKELRQRRDASVENKIVSSDEAGSEQRYENRVETFQKENKPVYKHHAWWLIHNCIAHPLIGIIPSKATFDFHDWTSKKINGE